MLFMHAQAAKLGDRQLMLSSSKRSDKAMYKFSFTLSTPGTLGSIAIQFCANDPFPNTPCTAPAGFDATAAILASQTGEAGFSISGASTANNIILTRTPGAAGTTPVGYTFNNITNPSNTGMFFARLQIYASDDASGAASDYGGLAFAINESVNINAEVPPYLIFCTGVVISTYNCNSTSGSYINFGELSPNYTSSGTSQLMAGTNAEDGYSVSVTGTTMTSGNQVIKPLNSDVSRPGTSQFGMNLRANNTPRVGVNPNGNGGAVSTPAYSQVDFYRFVPNETVITRPAPDEMRRFTASYIVNVPRGQAPGIYSSTITYVALANF